MPDNSFPSTSEDLHGVFDLAQSYHRQGNVAEAERFYRYLIGQLPGSAAPRHMLGLLLLQQGRRDEALAAIAAAIGIDPGNADALAHYGQALRSTGRFGEAVAAYDKALAIKPGLMTALIGRGHALRSLASFEEALNSFDGALKLAPRDPGLWLNRGTALSDMQRFDEALASYETGLSIEPGHPGLANNRGLALFSLGRLEEALASFETAIARQPQNWEALNNRGLVLFVMCRYPAALASYDKALALRPDDAGLHNNRGTALLELGRPEEALQAFEAALALRPDHIDALNNRGRQLLLLNRLKESLQSYERVLALNPEDANALGGVAELALRLCDWPRAAGIARLIEAHVKDGKAGISPLCLMGYSDDAALELQCARNHVRANVLPAPAPLRNGTPNRNSRIRIAYLSTDFQDHPVARLLAPVIERHERSRFETIGVSLGADDGSEVRKRLERAFESFTGMNGRSDAEIAQWLKAERVDIAVDLNGHTRGSRPGILARRPAPVQVNFLGFAGSTGADFMDYIIGDPVITPFSHAAFFSEKIVQLPDCYLAAASGPAHGSSGRGEAGLPAEGFVFACFNSSWKITASMFDIWMRLLAAVPGSVLWLPEFVAEANANLRAEAAARGVAPARLIFAPPVPLQEHLARQRLADLFLDTLPFNAHSTAADALGAGLPVLTCRGHSFASRVAASLLHAAGLDELVTGSLEEYESVALKLAREGAPLSSLRERLGRNRLTHPLFDLDRYRRHIEAAYIKMWETAGSGENPRSFKIES
ncbi:MAG TPA: tetratricopeptide repeat protein [Rhizomicrobium sp.]|nr:tetratricopeptide repeat protein [Rhizomicrobium sp.]